MWSLAAFLGGHKIHGGKSLCIVRTINSIVRCGVFQYGSIILVVVCLMMIKQPRVTISKQDNLVLYVNSD